MGRWEKMGGKNTWKLRRLEKKYELECLNEQMSSVGQYFKSHRIEFHYLPIYASISHQLHCVCV